MSERISLKRIDREMRAVARKLRIARRRAEAGQRGTLDALMKRLEGLQSQTADMCGRTYGVWPPPAAPVKPAIKRPKPKPGTKPSKPAKPKPKRKKGGR
jgi:hypothetical protein